eukprot:TRINITY_DN5300_c0_g1_i1.p1 TRINITY_DN5300_c0_g1~~TRINITY_DN5300_c0_g1_i1.p1  ORF type:complete len:262 (+),score=63.78 TRINITY_DN5300_c0_g1_i1:90-788(+)
MAKVAQQASRFDEMVDYMIQIADLGVELNIEERNLFSIAFKNVVTTARNSWRIISSLEQKEQNKGRLQYVDIAREYKESVEIELAGICNQALEVLNEKLIPHSKDEDALIFYNKMRGDYYRYFAEYTSGEDQSEYSNMSLQAYTDAKDIAERTLPPTDPVRLGLALNFSVFYYDIRQEPERACELAKAAFDNAVNEVETLGPEEYKQTKAVLQLLSDNLKLWTGPDATPEED